MLAYFFTLSIYITKWFAFYSSNQVHYQNLCRKQIRSPCFLSEMQSTLLPWLWYLYPWELAQLPWLRESAWLGYIAFAFSAILTNVALVNALFKKRSISRGALIAHCIWSRHVSWFQIHGASGNANVLWPPIYCCRMPSVAYWCAYSSSLRYSRVQNHANAYFPLYCLFPWAIRPCGFLFQFIIHLEHPCVKIILTPYMCLVHTIILWPKSSESNLVVLPSFCFYAFYFWKRIEAGMFVKRCGSWFPAQKSSHIGHLSLRTSTMQWKAPSQYGK